MPLLKKKEKTKDKKADKSKDKKDQKKHDAKDTNDEKKQDTKDKKDEKKHDKNVTPSGPKNAKSEVMVRFGKPVMLVNFKRIKFLVTVFALLFIIIAILSLHLLVLAIRIRAYLGAFINMISSGDGEILPSLLAIPTFTFLCIDIVMVFFIYKIFSKKKNPLVNMLLFILILIALVVIVASIIVIFATLGHVYSANKGIQNGIVKAMEKYAVNSFYKKQMDRLQIEFQCCGSKKYDDWYNITWMEKVLSTNKSVTQSGKTPFSCCAIRSKFPCIHYDIEKTGKTYLYTPEFNLSVSADGCYTKVMEKKQRVGLGIVGSLFMYIFLELLLLIPARFLQTAHSIESKFEGNKRTYTVWLLGSYTGKSQANEAPEPPPVPPELMD